LQVLQNLLLRSEKRIKHENEAAAGKIFRGSHVLS